MYLTEDDKKVLKFAVWVGITLLVLHLLIVGTTLVMFSAMDLLEIRI